MHPKPPHPLQWEGKSGRAILEATLDMLGPTSGLLGCRRVLRHSHFVYSVCLIMKCSVAPVAVHVAFALHVLQK